MKKRFIMFGLLMFVLMLGLSTAMPIKASAAAMDENFDGATVGYTGTKSYTLNGMIYTSNNVGEDMEGTIEIRDAGDIASGPDHALAYSSSGPNSCTLATFKTADGSEFKLNSFVIGEGFGADISITVSGYKDGIMVATTTFNFPTSFYDTLDVSADPTWENIDEVRMSGTDIGPEIDDLDVSPAVVGSTYSVNYNANGSTGGSVPVDGTAYYNGATVTVLGNTGSLVKTHATFAGWNTASDGSGISYAPAATFAMGTSNMTLYAQWTPDATYNGGNANNKDNNGLIVKDQQQDMSAPATNMNNTTENLKNIIFTTEELKKISAGEDAKVILKVTDISDSVNADEKKLIEEKLSRDRSVLYIDLSLYKKIGNETETKITETRDKISISIEIPEEIRNTGIEKNRTYQVIRIHDGATTIIEGTYDSVTHLFTFQTDRFSTYVLTYEDAGVDESANSITIVNDFYHLRLSAKAAKTEQKLTYNKVSGADGYIIYGAPCGSNNKFVKLADVSGKITSYKNKGLNKDTYYKYKVKAYKIINGKKVIIAISKVIHSITTSKTYANPTKVTADTSAITLAVGASKILTCQVVLPEGKKMKNHTIEIRYESSNDNIAIVSRRGKIKAISKGTCYVYAYAQNGVYKKIKVTIE